MIVSDTSALLFDLFLFLSWFRGTYADGSEDVAASLNDTASSTAAPVVETTAFPSNGTYPGRIGDLWQNRGMILRMTYVLVGVSLLVLCYFLVKAIRMRRKRTKPRKYGVLINEDKMEISALRDDEDDDEVEVFEVNGSNIRGGRTSDGGAATRLLP